MRLRERYKQTFYVSNETEFGSGEFGEPYAIRGIYTPRNDIITSGGGVSIQGNTDSLKFETSTKGVELITQNSLIWIKRVPDASQRNGDNTHVVRGRSGTSNGWFITVHCESVNGGVPII